MVGAIRELPAGRAVVLATGLLGGLWGAVVALGALDVTSATGPLHPLEGRAGDVHGLSALAMAVIGLAGALIVPRLPALSCTLTFVAAVGGFLAVGLAWLPPGLLLSAAACVGLAVIDNPFAQEMARDRARAAAPGAHDPPG